MLLESKYQYTTARILCFQCYYCYYLYLMVHFLNMLLLHNMILPTIQDRNLRQVNFFHCNKEGVWSWMTITRERQAGRS